MADGRFQANYEGRVVLVTGAANGISRATAIAFAKAGAMVLALDRDGARVNDTVATIRSDGGKAEAFAVDLAAPGAFDAMVSDAVGRHGRIDCAFNGAAIGSQIHGTIVDYDDEHWDRVMNVNLRGMFICLRAEIRQMIAQGGGAIVNVASIGGVRATPSAPAYIASKHGVIGLTRAVAIDHAVHNIRINGICPSYIGGTTMMDSFIAKDPEGRTALINSAIPLGRIGKGSEIADAALWLCSDAASFVTGTMIYVDGGVTAK